MWNSGLPYAKDFYQCINARLGKIFMEVHNGIRRESSQPNRLHSRRPNDISNNQTALIAFASVASKA